MPNSFKSRIAISSIFAVAAFAASAKADDTTVFDRAGFLANLIQQAETSADVKLSPAEQATLNSNFSAKEQTRITGNLQNVALARQLGLNDSAEVTSSSPYFVTQPAIAAVFNTSSPNNKTIGVVNGAEPSARVQTAALTIDQVQQSASDTPALASSLSNPAALATVNTIITNAKSVQNVVAVATQQLVQTQINAIQQAAQMQQAEMAMQAAEFAKMPVQTGSGSPTLPALPTADIYAWGGTTITGNGTNNTYSFFGSTNLSQGFINQTLVLPSNQPVMISASDLTISAGSVFTSNFTFNQYLLGCGCTPQGNDNLTPGYITISSSSVFKGPTQIIGEHTDGSIYTYLDLKGTIPPAMLGNNILPPVVPPPIKPVAVVVKPPTVKLPGGTSLVPAVNSTGITNFVSYRLLSNGFAPTSIVIRAK